MNNVLKYGLVAIVSLIGLYLLCYGVLGLLFADFFSGPSEKECVKIAEQFLGYKFGKKYEFLDYDADFCQPDRQLNYSFKLPSDRFQAVVKYCEEEAKKDSEAIRTKDDEYDVITCPIHRTVNGYEKSEEVLLGDDRIHYQVLYVILDESLIVFDGMGY